MTAFVRQWRAASLILGIWLSVAASPITLMAGDAKLPEPAQRKIDFVADVQPILAKNCYACHGPKKQKGAYRLDIRAIALKGSEVVPIVRGKSAESPLIQLVAGVDPDSVMPPEGERLTAEQIGVLRAWIDQGAVWPDAASGEGNPLDWWSLRPVLKPPVPPVSADDAGRVHTPIDAFILAKLREKKLAPAPEADRRTLLRRVYLDLSGLPPTPEELDAFTADTSVGAYEKVVDRLLASPRYGERWARHWMDVVHFGETHGHDQDRVRPNAWPYRDYLIRSFNTDTPFARFIQEQVAADVMFPAEPQLTPALGFIAAGPWDESSLRDIREDSLCRQIGYYLDRDDMVMQTMVSFTSSTVHCARCHDHKFDPISQQDYYALQAVFAGIGRADRSFDADPQVHNRRKELRGKLAVLEQRDARSEALLQAELTPEFEQWLADKRAALENTQWMVLPPEQVLSRDGMALTRQMDDSLLASGFVPETDVYTIGGKPGLKTITGVRLEVLSDATLPHNGPGRQDNGNLHLSEFSVRLTLPGQPENPQPVKIGKVAADFSQKDWTIAHAIDGKKETAWGIYPEVGKAHWAIFEFTQPLQIPDGAVLTCVLEQLHGGKHLIGRPRLSVTASPNPAHVTALPQELIALLAQPAAAWTAEQKRVLSVIFVRQKLEQQLAALPPPQLVYAGAADFKADGSHRPVAAPRAVHLLKRGDILKPADAVPSGALNALPMLKGRFELQNTNDEGERRAALARWLSDPANPLTWRSIVNRVWHYHFGRGIVNSPNDFGRMGSQPSHPELLDWLTANFVENKGSLKWLHRLIVTSAVYRQSSRHVPEYASSDGDNIFLWRMNRQRLDAECVHDSILQFSGKLDLTMGGPSVQQFALSPGVHVTPVVNYNNYDWTAPGSGRRSVYRFVFRTLPDPFMDALDGADSSQLVGARNVSVTPLQALALLNNQFMLKQCEQLAARLATGNAAVREQIRMLYRLVLLREPQDGERAEMEAFVARFGLVNACRVLLNGNEFMFVD